MIIKLYFNWGFVVEDVKKYIYYILREIFVLEVYVVYKFNDEIERFIILAIYFRIN